MKLLKNILSRRTFLGRLLWSAASFLFMSFPGLGLSQTTSKVVSVSHPGATDGSGGMDNENLVDDVITEMVNKGITSLTCSSDLKSAWEQIIPDPSKKVAIKVNCQITGIYTKAKVVKPITDGLILRGVSPDNIIIYDQSDTAFSYAGFTKNSGEGIKVGTVAEFGNYSDTSSERLAKLLTGETEYACDYLINVPVMKALDGYTGVTMSMKNHYGSIKYPSHDDLMTRIPAINNMPEIKDKTRLIVVDAIFAEYKWMNGRDQSYIDIANKIMLTTDPVAADYLGWGIINELRSKHGLSPAEPEPAYIQTAADLGIGTNNPDNISHDEINLV